MVNSSEERALQLEKGPTPNKEVAYDSEDKSSFPPEEETRVLESEKKEGSAKSYHPRRTTRTKPLKSDEKGENEEEDNKQHIQKQLNKNVTLKKIGNYGTKTCGATKGIEHLFSRNTNAKEKKNKILNVAKGISESSEKEPNSKSINNATTPDKEEGKNMFFISKTEPRSYSKGSTETGTRKEIPLVLPKQGGIIWGRSWRKVHS